MCSQSSSGAKVRGTVPSTAISDRIRRNCRALNPSGLPKSPSPTSRQATLCNAARVSTNDSPMRPRSCSSPLGAGVDSVMTPHRRNPSRRPARRAVLRRSRWPAPAEWARRPFERGQQPRLPQHVMGARRQRRRWWSADDHSECPSDTRNVRLEWPSPMAWAVMAGPHSPRSARNAPSCWSSPPDHDHISCPGSTGSPDSFPAMCLELPGTLFTVDDGPAGAFADHRLHLSCVGNSITPKTSSSSSVRAPVMSVRVAGSRRWRICSPYSACWSMWRTG